MVAAAALPATARPAPMAPDAAPAPVGPVSDDDPAAAPPPVDDDGPTAQQLLLTGVSGPDSARSAVFTLDGVRTPVAVGDSFGSGGARFMFAWDADFACIDALVSDIRALS